MIKPAQDFNPLARLVRSTGFYIVRGECNANAAIRSVSSKNSRTNTSTREENYSEIRVAQQVIRHISHDRECEVAR